MDTASKRFSAVNVQAPWRGIGIFPSGTVDQPARYALAHLYSGFTPGGDVDLELDAGQILIGGGSATANLGLPIGGGAVTIAGQAQTLNRGMALSAGAVTIAGQTVDLLAELDIALEIGGGLVTIAGQTLSLEAASAATKHGGDDVPRESPHRGHDKRRAQLKLTEEQRLLAQIRSIYRKLSGTEQASAAEAVLAPEPVQQLGESAEARAAYLEAKQRAAEERFEALAKGGLEAEIALRLVYRELRDLLERDDERAIESILAQLL